jgi:hypothetical protein
MRRSRGYGWLLGLALIPTVAAWAAEERAPSDPSTELRRRMADAHRKMAACLESERPFGECRAEMMKACQSMMGEHGCPMMGPMGGMRHGPGMTHESPSE